MRIKKNILIMAIVAVIVISSISAYLFLQQDQRNQEREIYVGFSYKTNITIINYSGYFDELLQYVNKKNWTITYSQNKTHLAIHASIPAFQYVFDNITIDFYDVKVWCFIDGQNYHFPVPEPGNYTFYIFLESPGAAAF